MEVIIDGQEPTKLVVNEEGLGNGGAKTPEQIAAEAAAAAQQQTTPEQLSAEQKAAEEAAKAAAQQGQGQQQKTIAIESQDGSVADYVLDADGNATLNGEIVYTRQQLLDAGFENNSGEGGSGEEDEDIHLLISQLSGVELTDNDGKPVTFKEGVDGLAEREVYVKNTFYAKGREEALSDIFQKNPDLYEMFTYKQKHGSLDNYVKQTNFTELQVTDETDSETLKSFIREHLLSIGNDASTVEKLIRLSENEETLRLDATVALDKLKEAQKNAILAQQSRERENAAKEIERIQKHYGISVDGQGRVVDLNYENSLYDKIVKKGTIGDIIIPKEGLIVNKDGKKQQLSRLDVFAYFYNPVGEEGLSQAEIDERKRLGNSDNFVIQGIKNLTGGDLSSLRKAMEAAIRIDNSKKIIKMTTKHSTNNSNKPKNIEEQINKGTARIIMP